MGWQTLGKELGALAKSVWSGTKEAGAATVAVAKKDVEASLAERPVIAPVSDESRAAVEQGIQRLTAEELKGETFNIDFAETMMKEAKDSTTKLHKTLTEIYNGTKVESNKQFIRDRADEIGLKFEVEGMEQGADPIDVIMGVEGVTGIKRRFQSAFEDQVARDRINAVRSQVEAWIGTEKVEAIMQRTDLNLFGKAQELNKANLAIQDRINVEMMKDPEGILAKGNKLFEDLNGMSDRLYRMFSKVGLSSSADAVREFSLFNTKGKASTERIKNLIMQTEDVLTQYEKADPARARAMRKYKEIAQTFDKDSIRGGGIGQPIPIDAEAAMAIKERYGVDLTAKDVAFINRWKTVDRLAVRNLHRQKELQIYENDLPYLSIEDINPSSTEHWFEKYGRYDFGHQWNHLKPTSGYLEKRFAEKPELRAVLESTKDDFLANQTHFLKEKQVGIASSFEDANRVSPADELREYWQQYTSHIRRSVGGDRIRAIAHTIALPKDGITSRQPLYKELSQLQSFYNETLTSNVPGGAWGKFASGLTQTMVSTALFKAPMVMANALQAVVNGATQHGFANTILATGAAGIRLPWYTIKNHDKLHDAWLDAANSFRDPKKREIVRRIIAESSETRRFLDEDMTELNRKVNGVLNIFTAPFELSDRIARTATLSAAYDHANSALKAFEKNLVKHGHEEAKIRLMKDLHLATWRQQAREDFMTTVLKERQFDKAKYEYAKYSTDSENFIYSKDSAPRMIAWARAQNPLLGQAMIFASYPMHYYNQIVKGAFNAAKEGDKLPLMKLGLFSMAWIAGMKMAETDSPDGSDITAARLMGMSQGQMAAYLINKGPGVSLLSLPELAYRPIGNLFTGVAGISEAAMMKVPLSIGNIVESIDGVKDTDSLDWQYLQAMTQWKRSLPAAKIRALDEIWQVMKRSWED